MMRALGRIRAARGIHRTGVVARCRYGPPTSSMSFPFGTVSVTVDGWPDAFACWSFDSNSSNRPCDLER